MGEANRRTFTKIARNLRRKSTEAEKIVWQKPRDKQSIPPTRGGKI